MKLFVKRIFTFIPFAVLGYCFILLFWCNLIPFDAFKKNLNYKMGSYGHLYTRINEADTLSKADILILGSSHAYRGFDPRLFKASGLKVFNLGSSNQTPKQAIVLLQSYLNQTSPELVIYEVYPGIFQQDGLESTLDLVANSSLNLGIVELVLKSGNVKAYNALINRLFMQTTGQYQRFYEPIRKQKDNDTYISGGYVQKDDNYLRDQSLNGSYTWSIKDDQWEYLEKIKTMLSDLNIKLLMVQSPIDSTFYRNGENNLEIDQKFLSLGDYINFNNYMSLHYGEDLYDLHHLRQSGVEKFNRLLIQKIKQAGYLE